MTPTAPTTARSVVARVQERLLTGGGDGEAFDVDRVAAVARTEAPLLDGPALERLVDDVVAEVVGLGPLEPLLRDPTVTEVMVNGPGPVWVERSGVIRRSGLRVDRAAIERIVERVVAPLGLRADRTAPIVDARLPDGSRVHIVLPPLAVDGPCVTIRRFGAAAVPLTAFGPSQLVDRLAAAVFERRNIVVSGGTASGKTTLLNALAGRIPIGERVVTVEDTAELRLASEHVVRLEGRPANAEGAGEATLRDLVRAALRMRPDRIIVGECRGGEALDMLQAMNTGHEGSLTTCHANSPVDAIRRLETMVLSAGVDLPLTAVREHLAASVDLVVQVERTPTGSRRVVAVAEVPADPPAPGSPWVVRSVAPAEVEVRWQRPARRPAVPLAEAG
jgi:pilus assembly protein CpaF